MTSENRALTTPDPSAINLNAIHNLSDTVAGDEGRKIDSVPGPFMILAATVRPNIYGKGTDHEREGHITSLLAIIDPERPTPRELYSNSEYVASKVEALLADGYCTPDNPVVAVCVKAQTAQGYNVTKLAAATSEQFNYFTKTLAEAIKRQK